ncbi:MAG: hypothetical protein ACRC3H_24335 [Lachnospiraceae bacterium]
MKTYADYNFYVNDYLCSREAKIQEKPFEYWSKMASMWIDEYTFGSLHTATKLPDLVGLCCCEVAEKLYEFEKAKGDNGLIVKSYGNDGETASFATSGMTEGTLSGTIKGIVRRWLANTGYLYCGGGGCAKP